MKKNKHLLILAVVLALAIAATALAACDGKAQTSHTHNYVEVAPNSPTCVKAGNSLYYTCECGKYFDANKNEIELSDTVIPATGEHTETWEVDVEATCVRDGHKYKKCAVCGEKLDGEETIPKTGEHTWGDKLENGKAKCTVCGLESEIYKSENGKIYFGNYPQSEVDDAALIAELNAKAGEKPTLENAHGWSKYIKYYYEGEATFEEDMWYIDVEHGGNKYRGVYFLTNLYFAIWYHNNNSNQLSNGYEVETVYWFKWEPIEWVSVRTDDNKMTLVANLILDGQYWSAADDGYKNSNIRQWLNENFYADAFNDVEAKFILQATVDNSAASTSNPDNPNVCEDTLDKVFLPSESEVTTMHDDSFAINRKTTAYARVRGAYTVPESNKGLKKYHGYGTWWLRSQNATNATKITTIMYDGSILNDYYYRADGIVPALLLTL